MFVDQLHPALGLIEDEDYFVAVVVKSLHALPYPPLNKRIRFSVLTYLSRRVKLRMQVRELNLHFYTHLLNCFYYLQVEVSFLEIRLQPIFTLVLLFNSYLFLNEAQQLPHCFSQQAKMSSVYLLKSFMYCPHEFEGELAYLNLERHFQFLGDRLPPEQMRRVIALVDNHAVDGAKQGHELNMALSHIFEPLILKINNIVDLLVVQDPLPHIFPAFKAVLLLIQGEALADKCVYTVELIVVQGNLILVCHVLPKDSLGVFVFVLFAKGTNVVYQIVEDYSKRPDVVFWLINLKVYHVVLN